MAKSFWPRESAFVQDDRQTRTVQLRLGVMPRIQTSSAVRKNVRVHASRMATCLAVQLALCVWTCCTGSNIGYRLNYVQLERKTEGTGEIIMVKLPAEEERAQSFALRNGRIINILGILKLAAFFGRTAMAHRGSMQILH